MRQLLKVTSMLVVLTSVGSSLAQNAAPSAAPLFYDVTQETTLAGTVADISTTAAPKALPGAHLTLTTPNGAIDVSLGAFVFAGKGSLPVTGGEQVELTGISKVLQGRQVFLARLLKVGDNVYAIRNSHGLPITPASHERANQKAQNGETR